MCGIAGIISYCRYEEATEDVLRRMCSVLRHRGPDDQGIYITDFADDSGHKVRVALCNCRLSVIDPTGGHQPMSNEDGTIYITHNGEIYNFQELRQHLAQRHVFKTRSDTEVILHLYEELGIECLYELRGMFAFAIWDARAKRLFCARDRLGKKPFVYRDEPDRFLFASEIKAILECPHVPRDLLPEALDLYLTYQYVPHPLTIFKGIRKLPPGHYLVVERGACRVVRYWTPQFEEDNSLTEAECVCRIRELLAEAVRLRMVSDVPLGVFLSGGVDSSIVTGLMCRASGAPVKTFSIGFEEKKYDELRYARIVARAFNTEHHEFVVRPNAAEVILKLAAYHDEPFADSSAIPTFYVSQMTREHVKVALSGEGGDECFLGYPRYLAMKISAMVDRLPHLRKLLTLPFWQRLPITAEPKAFLDRAKRLLQGLALDPEERYLLWVCIFTEAQKRSLYTQEFSSHIMVPAQFVKLWPVHLPFAARAAATDMLNYLPCDLLTKVDIASMAHSLEVRCPFLDHKFVEFAIRIPERLKIRGMMGTKYILKKAFADFLPTPVLHRGKMGFGVPIAQWFRSELRGYLQDVLLDPSTLNRGYFRPHAVREMVAAHLERRADHAPRIWALLMLELWHRKYCP